VPEEEIDALRIRPETAAPPFPIQEDFETLLYDYSTGALYLVSKNRVAEEANIYKIDYPDDPADDVIYGLPLVGTIAYDWLVGGDVTPDGGHILMRKGKNFGAYMWPRDVPSGQSVEDALERNQPCFLQLVEERQGEALAVSEDGIAFFTTSESDDDALIGVHEDMPIYKYYFV